MKWFDRYYSDRYTIISDQVNIVHRTGTKIPLFKVVDNVILLNFDQRIGNDLFKELKYLSSIEKQVYLVSRLRFDPKLSKKPEREVIREDIRNFLHNYTSDFIFFKDKKFNLNIINFLSKYVADHSAFDILTEEYNKNLGKVNATDWDFFSGKKYNIVKEEIREKYYSLLRDIKIKYILL